MKKFLLFLAVIISMATVAKSQIVISEIMFNPPEFGTDSLEFVELYNAGTTSVDLNGYSLYFGTLLRDSFTSSTILPAGGLIVIAVNDSAVYNQFNMTVYPRQWTGSGLNNTGTIITLYNNGTIADTVRYSSSWENLAAGNGSSIILCDPASDNALSVNWDTSTVFTGNIILGRALKGSPGVLESCAVAVVASYPIYSIGTVNNATLNGVADSLNVSCELRGVVHSIDFDGNAGYDFTLIDYTHEGITVFSNLDKNGYTSPAMGDSIQVKGTILQFNGLIQIAVDSVSFIQPGVALLNPINLNVPLDDSYENKLVRVASVTLVDPLQWTGTGAGFNVDVTNGTNTWTMRIDNDCVWYGLPAPTGTIDVIGTVSQFDNSMPYDSGYQIRPRIITDILTQGAVPAVFFSGNAVSVNENVGTVTLTLNIVNADANPTSVDVRIGSSSTATAADYSNFTSPTTVTFPGGSSATQQVTIDIVDDSTPESNETIVFELFNITNNGIFGADSIYTITIIDNDAAATPLHKLVITEINYNNPAADSIEFIEIYNNDTATINLAGYQLTNGIFITFPSFILAPGAFVVASQDSALFSQRFGISTFQWNSGNSLNNTGEPLVLKNNLGQVLDSVFYRNSAPWPTGAAGNGPSAQLCDVNSDNNNGANWGSSNNPTGVFVSGVQIFATPGAANTYCRGVYPYAPIGNIDNTNANGEPDSLGLDFEIRGVVHCGDFRVGTGLELYLIDYLNNGIKVFSSSDRGYTVNDGDSLNIWGRVSQGNGVTEFLVDSIFFISAGNPTVTPTTITSALNETHEGSLIRINNVSLANPTQWTGSGPGFNVDITNGSTTWQLRIDDAVNHYSQAAPTGAFNVYGIGSQFDNTLPFTSGYQLLACNSSITPFVVGTDVLENLPVQIYPNPANDVLNISAYKIDKISISNMLGQEILRMENVNADFQTLSIQNLNSGIYNIAILSNDKVTVKQFIKK